MAKSKSIRDAQTLYDNWLPIYRKQNYYFKMMWMILLGDLALIGIYAYQNKMVFTITWAALFILHVVIANRVRTNRQDAKMVLQKQESILGPQPQHH